MENRILITYASKYGSTIEIAEKIAGILEEAMVPVNLQPVGQHLDINSYRGVILGSPIYVGRWRPEAVSFLAMHEKLLSHRDVWLFSSGPTGEGDPVDILDGWLFPREQLDLIERIAPQDITLFHGAIDFKKLDYLEKNTIKHLKVEIGDYRDWDAITNWASKIASALKSQPKPTAP